ncbi:TonB-dependent receptor [Hellea sp.]|nr:TonB-dependent receptor [Hellea sp.]
MPTPSRNPIRIKPMKALLLGGASISMLAMAQTAMAQASDPNEVITTGIRQSLENALIEKRQADSLVEVILAEDIGKLPDQNLAEVLENITGIQITRENGVGTGVQIRGTDSNRLEINGVSSVGAGNGRQGLNFEDINPAIIAGVEVIKAPDAKQIEGSVGGTINLRTIRPLDLKKPLLSVRGQLEDSSLSQDGVQPRLSGAIGNSWENSSGQEIGYVVSGSYTKSKNSAFRPRLDRDNLTTCDAGIERSSCPAGATHFVGVQFLNQVQEEQDFETYNISGSAEYKPTENIKLFGDIVYTDQTRNLAGSRAQFSNVSRLNGDGQPALSNNNDPLTPEFADSNINFTAFDTFDLGSDASGADLGSILAVTAGTFTPFQGTEPFDSRGAPFLRSSSDNGSRQTDSYVFRGGAEWEKGPFSASAEYSRANSKTVNPNLSSTLNFINPNSGITTRDENGIPIIFDFSDGISFGINFADPFAPTVDDLLNANNYVVDGSPTYSANEQRNTINAWRVDGSYDFADSKFDLPFIKSIDTGYRYARRTTMRDNRQASSSGSGSLANSLNAGAIAQLLAPIPDNFGSGTNSDLFVQDLLHINPNIVGDPIDTINTLNAAAAAQGLGPILGTTLESRASEFFDIEEETNAIYGQINFESDFNGIGFRGNVGLRYVDTDISADANIVDINGVTPITIDSGYDHFLPRINLVVDATDDIAIRGSYNREINRPSFTSIAPARTFPNTNGVNSNSVTGNPFIEPEEIDAFDVSAEWYFAPEAVLSVGYFYKSRDGLFGTFVDEPGGVGDPGVIAPDTRDVIGPVCEAGGIFSAGTSPGIFGDEDRTGLGVCVGDQFPFNSDNSTTQQGIEVALQYNLAGWEDRLGGFGWASGFGIIANYTYQTEDNNTGVTPIAGGRAQAIFAAQGFDTATNPAVRETATLLNLSKNAYNLTGYYEKYGLSARLRYTYRSSFRTDDLPGTGNVFDPLGFRGVNESRGQLNGSLSYDINDNFTVNVDAVNLTESSSDIFCVNNNALLCYEGITDRRIQFGGSYTF